MHHSHQVGILKILVLYPKTLWEKRQSASRRHDIEALQARADVSLKMSGQGWDDWDNAKSALLNARAIMPDADVIYTYKLKGNAGLEIPPVIDARGLSEGFLVAQRFQECWEPNKAWGPTKKVSDFILSEGVDLAILSHANDRKRLRKAEKHGVQVAVIPIAAKRSIFAEAARPWEERDIDILLTGNIGSKHYPLRTRYHRLITEGRLSGHCHIHERPGSWADNIDDADAKVREFADVLGRAKISLCCSSKYRYPLAKYVESAMAGCCVVGDMPELPPDEYRDFVRPLKSWWSDRKLVKQIEKYLQADDIKEFAVHGQQVVLNSLTWEHWTDMFLSAITEAKRIKDAR